MQPPQYWRANKKWSTWLGQTGTVLASTLVNVAGPETAAFVPYSYVIVDFGHTKAEFMGADQQVLSMGDQVECVLRKIAINSDASLIEYGIKVRKI